MQKRGEAVKKKILDTATDLFYNQGYNLTGINQVIEEADIAKRSLYNHFDSKTDILLAYLDQLQTNLYKNALEFLRPYHEPKQKLLALFDYRINNQLKMNYGGCAFVKINAEVGNIDERITQRVQKNKNQFKTLIGGIVSEFEGTPLQLPHKELAQMIFLMMEGAITTASIYKNVEEIRSAKKILEKLL